MLVFSLEENQIVWYMLRNGAAKNNWKSSIPVGSCYRSSYVNKLLSMWYFLHWQPTLKCPLSLCSLSCNSLFSSVFAWTGAGWAPCLGQGQGSHTGSGLPVPCWGCPGGTRGQFWPCQLCWRQSLVMAAPAILSGFVLAETGCLSLCQWEREGTRWLGQ